MAIPSSILCSESPQEVSNCRVSVRVRQLSWLSCLVLRTLYVSLSITVRRHAHTSLWKLELDSVSPRKHIKDTFFSMIAKWLVASISLWLGSAYLWEIVLEYLLNAEVLCCEGLRIRAEVLITAKNVHYLRLSLQKTLTPWLWVPWTLCRWLLQTRHSSLWCLHHTLSPYWVSLAKLRCMLSSSISIESKLLSKSIDLVKLFLSLSPLVSCQLPWCRC